MQKLHCILSWNKSTNLLLEKTTILKLNLSTRIPLITIVNDQEVKLDLIAKLTKLQEFSLVKFLFIGVETSSHLFILNEGELCIYKQRIEN